MHRRIFQEIVQSRDRVGMRSIQFYAYHGFHQEENRLGQRFLLHVDAWLDLEPAGISDSLDETLNYHSLHTLIHDWVTRHRFRLLERLAEGLAAEIFRRHGEVDALRLCVVKPQPPIPDFHGQVEVELTRVHPRLLEADA